MGSPFSAAYGAYSYQTPETRALTAINPQSYDYRDQSKLLTKLVGDTSYMAAYMRKMQAGIDASNQNFIQQIQGMINEMAVLFGGQGDTGFDFGDLKYVFQGIGALYGWDTQDGLVLPLNLNQAAWNFMNQYVIGSQDWTELMNQNFDASIATMLDIFGEVPVLGQSAQQLAVILSQMHDTNQSFTHLMNQFFSAFNITPQNPLPTLGDWFTNINTLYVGLQKLFGNTDYDASQSIFDDISRWDQQVIDAIAKLSQGDLSGFSITLAQLTNVQPNKQLYGDFSDIDSIAANAEGWSRDGSVGRTGLGSGRISAGGFIKAMAGTTVDIQGGQKLTPKIWVKWSGLACAGDAIILQMRCNNGQDIELQKITNPSANADWVLLTGTATIPNTATKAKPRLVVTGNCTAGTVWFDDGEDRMDSTLLPQDWIANLPTQQAQFAAMWGKQVEDLLGGPDVVEWWEDAIDNIFPPIKQQNIDQLNEFWDGIRSFFGLDHITDIPSISDDWWTQIINSFIIPSGAVAPTSATNALNALMNQLGDIFNNVVVNPLNQSMANIYTYYNNNKIVISSHGSWFTRFINDITVLLDFFHITYTQSQYNSAWADFQSLFNVITTGPAPAASAPTVGTRIMSAETSHTALVSAVTAGAAGQASTTPATIEDAAGAAIAGMTQTVNDLTSTVQSIQAGNSQQIGGNIIDDYGGGTASGWGSNWTTSGGTPVRQKGFYNNAGTVKGLYTGDVLNTDNQIVSIVFNSLAAMPWNGGSASSGRNRIKGRFSLDNLWGVYVDIWTNGIRFGYVNNGVDTPVGSFIAGTIQASANIELRLGTGVSGQERKFSVYQNKTLLASWDDTSTALTRFGASYRVPGQDQAYNGSYAPGNTRFHAEDVIKPLYKGIMGRHRNKSNTAIQYLSSGVYKVPYGWFDYQDYLTPGITLIPSGTGSSAGYVVQDEGEYEFEFAITVQSGALGAVNNNFIAAGVIGVNDAPISEGGTVYSYGTGVGPLTIYRHEVIYLMAGDKVFPAVDCRVGQWGIFSDTNGFGSWMRITKKAKTAA